MTVSLESYGRFVDLGNAGLFKTRQEAFLNAMGGLPSEAGEVSDILRKHALVGRPLDRAHLLEEIGDTLWYLVLAMNQIDADLPEVIDANVRKLCVRHPKWYGNEENWHDLGEPRPEQPLPARGEDLPEDTI